MGLSPSVAIPGGGSEGYHVLRVQDQSPGHCAGLEPFFDFIISTADTRLNKDNDTLKEILKLNVEKPVKMLVYSSKTLSVREVTVTPSTMWGGKGLLGLSIRFSSFEGANENVWHVLDVEPESPAAAAGLRAHSDYIIGADTLMSEDEDLFSLIEMYEGKELKLYVYSTESDNCREVLITPNCDWGGEGSLGCGIGYGYLHRIPTSCSHRTPALHHQDGLAEVSLSAVVPTQPISVAPAGSEPVPSDSWDLTAVLTSVQTGAPTVALHSASALHPASAAPPPGEELSPTGVQWLHSGSVNLSTGLPALTLPNLPGVGHVLPPGDILTQGLPPVLPLNLPGGFPPVSLPAADPMLPFAAPPPEPQDTFSSATVPLNTSSPWSSLMPESVNIIVSSES
ncbi:Golgi reassembly-stacking protein 2-like [Synchiropus splendidus]|uniref:Golgi reassembly-stacking protein 2-like n=1 Tax=Synchiropus splendidus TaxID=270530 RepID=UPI00237DA2B0|nr:Golgi reassembly-stacking protein 2-like [Synchiropus splendidus]